MVENWIKQSYRNLKNYKRIIWIAAWDNKDSRICLYI
jgi:hypothetical protein